MKLIQSAHGFSLVQVLVAAGIMGGLALGVMQITQNLNQVMTNATSTQDQITLFSEIDQILKNESSCRVSLAGENFEPSSYSVKKSQIDGTASYGQNVELFFSSTDGKTRAQKRFSPTEEGLKKYGSVTVENIQLFLDNGTGFDYPASDRHVDQGTIRVDILRRIGPGQTRLISRSFPVQLAMKTSGSGHTKILSCASLEAIAQERAACENAGRFYNSESDPPCSMTMNKINELTTLGVAQGNMGILRCPEGFGVTGVSGSSNSNNVKQFKVHCEPVKSKELKPDHNNPYGSPFLGSAGGSLSNSICGEGKWASGVRASVSSGVAGIGVNCSDYLGAARQQARLIGSASGISAASNCESKTVLRELAVYYTDKIEAVKGVCW